MSKMYFHPKKPRGIRKSAGKVGRKFKGVSTTAIGKHKTTRRGMGRHMLRGGY